MHASISLKPGKEKPVLQGHPWIFSGALQSAYPAIAPGAPVVIRSHDGRPLAMGYYNQQSQIAVRVLSLDPNAKPDAAFIRERLADSISRRAHLMASGETNALRLVASEADGLPGLIVDKYADWVVFQVLTAGMEMLKPLVIEALDTMLSPQGIIERSDEAVREKEGLAQGKFLHKGQLPREGLLAVCENGMHLLVDPWHGHKTGFYCDQRESRRIIGHYAKGLRVLNAFSYTGGFSIAALRGGATEVISVDESEAALSILRQHVLLNPHQGKSETMRADVFQYLRQLKAQGESFDMIILDPPKFVANQKQLDRATRGYKDINMLAMGLLRKNGLLASFSCSGLLSRELFQKVLFGASVDAKTGMQVVEQLDQAEDHPILLSFPESFYLKGFLLRKV